MREQRFFVLVPAVVAAGLAASAGAGTIVIDELLAEASLFANASGPAGNLQ